MERKVLFRYKAVSINGGETIISHTKDFVEEEFDPNDCMKLEYFQEPILLWTLPAQLQNPKEVEMFDLQKYYLGLKPRRVKLTLFRYDIIRNKCLNHFLIIDSLVRKRGKEWDDSASVIERDMGLEFCDYLLYPVDRKRFPGFLLTWWESAFTFLKFWVLLEETFDDTRSMNVTITFDYDDPVRPDRPTLFTYAVECVGVDLGRYPKMLETAFDCLERDRFRALMNQPLNLKYDLVYRSLRADTLDIYTHRAHPECEEYTKKFPKLIKNYAEQIDDFLDYYREKVRRESTDLD